MIGRDLIHVATSDQLSYNIKSSTLEKEAHFDDYIFDRTVTMYVLRTYLSALYPFSFSDLISISKAFRELAKPRKRRYSRIKSSKAW